METQRSGVGVVKLMAMGIVIIMLSVGLYGAWAAPANVNRFYGGGLSLASGGEGFSIGGDVQLLRLAQNLWGFGANDALNIPALTASRVLALNAGKNVTTTGIGVGTGDDLTGVDDLNATDVNAVNLYANTALIDGYYPGNPVSCTFGIDGATYWMRNETTGDITTNANFATLLNACIVALTKGGVISLKTGFYVIDNTITIGTPGFITLIGETRGDPGTGGTPGTIIKMADHTDKDMILITGDYCSIKNVALFHNKGVQAAGSVIIVQGHNSLIDTIHIYDSKNMGIDYQTATHWVLINSATHGCAYGIDVWSSSPRGLIDSCVLGSNGINIYGQLVDSTVRDSNIYSATTMGVELATSTGTIFENNNFHDNNRIGLLADTLTYAKIINNHFENNDASNGGYAALQLYGTSQNNTITGNTFLNTGAGTQTRGILIADTSDYNIINENTFKGQTTYTVNVVGTKNKIGGNIGYVIENSGTATIASGATSATVAHGLSYTPTSANTAWSVTYLELSTNDPGTYYITGMNATHAVINCLRDPGASNLDISWAAQRVP